MLPFARFYTNSICIKTYPGSRTWTLKHLWPHVVFWYMLPFTRFYTNSICIKTYPGSRTRTLKHLWPHFYHGPCRYDGTWSTHGNSSSSFLQPSNGPIRAKQITLCSSVIGQYVCNWESHKLDPVWEMQVSRGVIESRKLDPIWDM